MKKTVIWFRRILCLGIGVMCVNFLGYAVEATEKNESSEVITRGRMGADKYISTENCECNPETEHTLENGDKVYRKNIIFKKVFKKDNAKSNNNLEEDENSFNVDVTFTYDKNSFVKIDKRDTDVKVEKETKNWKLRYSTEILPSDEVCIVSNKYVTYKKSNLGVGDYIMTGHIDLLCSKLGEIGIHTELT